LTSKPTWRNTPGWSATSAFFSAPGGARRSHPQTAPRLH